MEVISIKISVITGLRVIREEREVVIYKNYLLMETVVVSVKIVVNDNILVVQLINTRQIEVKNLKEVLSYVCEPMVIDVEMTNRFIVVNFTVY